MKKYISPLPPRSGGEGWGEGLPEVGTQKLEIGKDAYPVQRGSDFRCLDAAAAFLSLGVC